MNAHDAIERLRSVADAIRNRSFDPRTTAAESLLVSELPAIIAHIDALRARVAELEALALQLECEASCYAADLAALKGRTDGRD